MSARNEDGSMAKGKTSSRGKEITPIREYEKALDKNPTLEKYAEVADVNGNIVRIPHPAFVHETGEFIQLNCCLSPSCSNFGNPCLVADDEDPSKSSSFILATNYSIEWQDETRSKKKTGRKFKKLKCSLCKTSTRILSNRSASELMSRFTRKYAPSIICERCFSGKLDDRHSDGDDKSQWDYANPSPNDFFGTHNTEPTRAKRLKCQKCAAYEKKPKIKHILWKRCPGKFSDIQDNPEKYVHIMHAVTQLSVNDFRRSLVYDNREVPDDEPHNDRLGRKYYRVLSWYHFFAIEWIGFYNNRIRFGQAYTKYTPEVREETGKQDEYVDSEKYDGDDSGESGDDVYPSDEPDEMEFKKIPKDIGEKDIPYYCMEQVQTDTILLSSQTPGSRDKRQELRLMISVLVPSGYILLATLDYSDQHNLKKLRDLDKKANKKKLDVFHEDRELIPHAHKERQTDYYSSPDRASDKGRQTPTDFGKRGARIRQPYHALAHYYVLEKIVSKIPELMLVQDGETGTKKAYTWAFRRRIAKGTCHVILSIDEKNKGDRTTQKGDKVRKDKKGLKKLTVAIEQEIDKVKSDIGSYKGGPTFHSDLFAQGKNGENLKKKVWLSVNTLVEKNSANAAMMLRGASLFRIDSVCNQVRQRVQGLTRGKVTSKNQGLSYISHWEDPIRIQQHADIFVFSSNCLAWHSTKSDTLPAVFKLELSVKIHRHLIHHIVSPEVTSEEFIYDKFRYVCHSLPEE